MIGNLKFLPVRRFSPPLPFEMNLVAPDPPPVSLKSMEFQAFGGILYYWYAVCRYVSDDKQTY
jgi:hypothetical protein